jgi:hypothetical protein
MNPRNASWTGTLAVVMAVKTKVGVEKVTEQSTVGLTLLSPHRWTNKPYQLLPLV